MAYILNLPPEIVQHIVQYVPDDDIESYTLTCKALLEVGANRSRELRMLNQQYGRYDCDSGSNSMVALLDKIAVNIDANEYLRTLKMFNSRDFNDNISLRLYDEEDQEPGRDYSLTSTTPMDHHTISLHEAQTQAPAIVWRKEWVPSWENPVVVALRAKDFLPNLNHLIIGFDDYDQNPCSYHRCFQYPCRWHNEFYRGFYHLLRQAPTIGPRHQLLPRLKRVTLKPFNYVAPNYEDLDDLSDEDLDNMPDEDPDQPPDGTDCIVLFARIPTLRSLEVWEVHANDGYGRYDKLAPRSSNVEILCLIRCSIGPKALHMLLKGCRHLKSFEFDDTAYTEFDEGKMRCDNVDTEWMHESLTSTANRSLENLRICFNFYHDEKFLWDVKAFTNLKSLDVSLRQLAHYTDEPNALKHVLPLSLERIIVHDSGCHGEAIRMISDLAYQQEDYPGLRVVKAFTRFGSIDFDYYHPYLDYLAVYEDFWANGMMLISEASYEGC